MTIFEASKELLEAYDKWEHNEINASQLVQALDEFKDRVKEITG